MRLQAPSGARLFRAALRLSRIVKDGPKPLSEVSLPEWLYEHWNVQRTLKGEPVAGSIAGHQHHLHAGSQITGRSRQSDT